MATKQGTLGGEQIHDHGLEKSCTEGKTSRGKNSLGTSFATGETPVAGCRKLSRKKFTGDKLCDRGNPCRRLSQAVATHVAAIFHSINRALHRRCPDVVTVGLPRTYLRTYYLCVCVTTEFSAVYVERVR